MGDSGYSFKQLGDALRDDENDVKPLTADNGEGGENAANAEWQVKDHIDGLRAEIHRLLEGIEELELAEGERLPHLKELFTPELLTEFKEITGSIKGKGSEDKDKKELVDINKGEIEERIEKWVEALKGHIRVTAKSTVNDDDLLALDAQCWMLFDAISNTVNARNFGKNIKAFFGERGEGVKGKEYDKAKKECIEEMAEQYGFSKVEMDILVDLVMTEGEQADEYTLSLFVKTMARLWKEYKLGDQKKDLAKVVFGHFMGTGAMSFAPSLFANLISPEGSFNLEAFLTYTALNSGGDFAEMQASVRMEEVTNKVNQRINERITQSLFFQEFEFIHEKSLGEIYSALERGKSATQKIITESIDEFAPILVGIAMSLAFMTKINPVLGGIGLAGLPVMYKVARRHSERIADIYKQEIQGSESVTTAISQIRSGLEEVRTSPDRATVEGHVRGLMGKQDELAKDRGIKEKRAWWKMLLPFDASSAIAGVVGSMLQKAGALSGGEVLASIFYSQKLNGPINRLVSLYFDKFARYIQDIKRMEEILGQYETLDLPDGEKEQARVPVSELDDYGISISGLHFKGILKNVDLEVKEGEFAVVVGPSGAGKSTLIRTIAGLHIPDQGEVKIGGVDVSGIKKYGPESIYSAMSYCNQSPQIFDEFTLRENLVLWTKRDISEDEIKVVMKKLHLDKFVGRLDEKVKHLSGGERVRIGVARTLLKGAKILLLDEPTASLDSTSSKEVRDVIKEMAKEQSGITIICVTHDPELINAGGRVVELETINGKRRVA